MCSGCKEISVTFDKNYPMSSKTEICKGQSEEIFAFMI